MTRKEVEDAPGVVMGTISLCGHAAYALFNPRATYLFVSKQFVRLVGVEAILIETELSMSIPMNDRVLVSPGCRNWG